MIDKFQTKQEIHDSDSDFSEVEPEIFSDSETFNEILRIYRKDNKKQYRNTKLPSNVAILMGEANQSFMFHNFDDALKKAYEIIRIYPDYSEPFHLIGLIYEEQGKKKEAAHFYTLASQLTQGDSKLWEKIGYLYKESQCYLKAAYSFGRALKSYPTNKVLLLERAECFELAGEIRKAIKSLEKIILSTGYTTENFGIIRKCAKLCTKINQTNKSIELLQNALKNSANMDYNIVNMICELYMKESKWNECLAFLDDIFYHKSEQNTNNTKSMIKTEDFSTLFDNVPLEIITQYGVCLTKMNQKEKADIVLNKVLQGDIYNYSDLFVEVAECYDVLGQYEKAVSVYENLINTCPEYNIPEIWLKSGILYNKMNDKQSAIDAFTEVLKENPDYTEAKMNLSEIYRKEGKIQDALKILDFKQESYVNEEDVFLSDEESSLIALATSSPSSKKNSKGKQQHQQQQQFAFNKRNMKYEYHNPHDDIQDELSMIDMPVKKVKLNEPNKAKHIPQIKDESTMVMHISKLKLTKETLEDKLNQLKHKYQVDHLILKYRQAQILFDEHKLKEYLAVIVEPLIQSLDLEFELQEIRKKLLNKFLSETQKKNFIRRMEMGLEDEDIDPDEGPLLKTKKSKIISPYFQKRKNKFSISLTEKQLENVQYLSKILGKEEYIKLILKVIMLLDKYEKYHEISIICEKMIRIKQDYLKNFSGLFYDAYIYGFISNYNLNENEKAFYYIKYLSKQYYTDDYIQALLSLCLKKIDDPAVYRIFMSKLQIRDLNKECKAIVQILGNHYLQTGFHELCVNTYYKLFIKEPNNPLYNLLLGVSFLQDSSSRTTKNKVIVIRRAFYFLKNYVKLRQSSHYAEAMYNLARTFSQLSMFKEAISIYERIIQLNYYKKYSSSKIAEISTLADDPEVEAKAITNNANTKASDSNTQSELISKKAAYNLIIIHKHLGNAELANQLINDFFTY